jgi:hypothetical protein
MRRKLLSLLCLAAALAVASPGAAQTVQFPSTTPFTPSTTLPPPPAAVATPGGSALGAPAPQFSPYPPTVATPGYGAPAGQPYVSPWPSTSVTPGGASTPWSAPATTTPSTWFPNTGTPTTGTPPLTAPPYPGYASPSSQQPGVIFPNGIYSQGSVVQTYTEPFRIFQHPRFSDTWVYGADNPNDVQIHDFEFAVTGGIPNFFGTTQPLYITPTFLLHLWDGPSHMPADLPSRAYSAFLDFFYATDPNRPVGFEVGVAVGAFTDFNTFNTHSIRVIGEGFGVVRLTPELTFKLGVWYLNRNDLKLLPAGGLVWQPNPQMKFDILFPNPKFTHYLSTVGTADVWWYIAGEYGGGAWTIQRADGSSDRVDINDIRIKLGLDWITQGNLRGYFEVGYVCDRQVVYVVNPSDSFTARNTFLLGAGFSF